MKVTSALIHKHRRLTTGKESPGCPELQELVSQNLVGMEEEAHDWEQIIQEGGDDGDDGDNHGAAMATGDAGYGVLNVDLGAVVDGILADLPEPARHHILPKLEEHDGARPAV